MAGRLIVVDPDKQPAKRKANRWQGFDYTSCCAYFITFCVRKGGPSLWMPGVWQETYEGGPDAGNGPFIVGAAISRPLNWQATHPSDAETAHLPLTKIGSFVKQAIQEVPLHYPSAEVDKYCVMPDHVHMILFLNAEEPGDTGPEAGGRLIAAPTAG